MNNQAWIDWLTERIQSWRVNKAVCDDCISEMVTSRYYPVSWYGHEKCAEIMKNAKMRFYLDNKGQGVEFFDSGKSA